MSGAQRYTLGSAWFPLLDLVTEVSEHSEIHDHSRDGLEVLSPAAINTTGWATLLMTGDYTNLVLNGMDQAQIWLLNPNGVNRIIDGIEVPLKKGALRFLVNIAPGATTITLRNEQAGATAARRILTPSAASVVLGSNQAVLLGYDPSMITPDRWRVLAKA